ncbi:MAG: hypothetical protein ABEK00_02095, partial [Candidatus Nanohaloarchaea archaeon]
TVDGGGDTGLNDQAGTFTDFTAYSSDSWGGTDPDDGKVWCGYEKTITVDADGPRALGDGFVVIHGSSIVATYNPKGNDAVGQKVRVVTSTASGSKSISTNSYLGGHVRGCYNGRNVCLRYVDYYTSTSGWSNWQDAVKNKETVYYPEESYSVCKMINYINEKNGNGNELVDCDYERSGNDISPLSEACGDEANEDLVATEGPEVRDSNMEDLLGYQQRCVDYSDQTAVDGTSITAGACVYKGRIYAEGSVVNIADKAFKENQGVRFEKGHDSADPEVCLNMNGFKGSSNDIDGDNMDEDADGALEENGGEWYDLDSREATTYLQTHSVDSNEWQTWWRDNPDDQADPSTGVYNSLNGYAGKGFAMEDDCHSSLDCEEIGTGTGSDGPFYTNFTEGARDDDFAHSMNWLDVNLTGWNNRVQAGTSSGNAGPGTGHGAGNTQDQETSLSLGPLENSHIDPEDDEWSISPNLTYVVNNSGESIAPGQCYGDSRSQGLDLNKRDRIYANSFANVRGLYDAEASGGDPDGVWIDPDNNVVSAERGHTSCDLAGKDWGYGYSNQGGLSP